MCDYCEYDEAGNLKWFRDEPDNLAWLEECDGEWGIVATTTARCRGTDCTTEMYLAARFCPMCGRDLRGGA